MATSSADRAANARNLHSLVLQRVAAISQAEVGRAAGIEKTAMHRIISGDRGVCLDEIEAFFDAIGLAAIECEGELVSLPRVEYEALKTLARRGLD